MGALPESLLRGLSVQFECQKINMSFKPKIFIAMLAVCAAIAGALSWLTGLKFWLLAAILVVAVLFNGLVASIEDKEALRRERDEPRE